MKFYRSFLFLLAAASIWGCFPAPILLGGLAGGGVYSVTHDTITDVFSMQKDQAFETMVGVLNSQQAKILDSSIADGKIHAQIGTSAVYISIEPYSADSVKITINAKKEVELVPDKDLSVRIYRLFIKETIK